MIAFVVGTGRSGTHWLGWTLDEHPGIEATIEKPQIFNRVTAAALDTSRERRTLRYLHLRYTWEIRKARPRLYVDKSHPNLWLVEGLLECFPQARFIAVRRNVYATVASMLKHDGVMRWHRSWREFPIPNRFLGITTEVARTYDDLPPAAQCALRWRAHQERIDELAERLPDRSFLVVEYESLAQDYDGHAKRIWDFLGLSHHPLSIEVQRDSLEKWRGELSPEEIEAIDRVVASSPERSTKLMEQPPGL